MTGHRNTYSPMGRFMRYAAIAGAVLIAGSAMQGCSQSDQRMRQLSDHKPPVVHIPGTTGRSTGETAGQNVGQIPGAQIDHGSVHQMGDGAARAVDRVHSIEGVSIGDTEAYLTTTWGKPARIYQSEFGFPWYTYTNNGKYDHFFLVGIREGRVYALFTNGKNWTGANGITDKSPIAVIRQTYHDNVKTQDTDTAVSYTVGKTNVTYYLDKLNNQKVLGVLLLSDTIAGTTRAKAGSVPPEEVRAGFERQIFDLTNAARVRYGHHSLTWDDKAAYTASVHSQDMAAREYFDDINRQGQSPFDRMLQAGINYQIAGENISAGQANGIEAFNFWMNSPAHRQNIFGNFQRLGTGVAVGGPMRIYYTQNYYTPH